jgi:hypothetical protein
MPMSKIVFRSLFVCCSFALLLAAPARTQEPAPPPPPPSSGGGDPGGAVGGGLVIAYRAYLDDQLWKWYNDQVKTEDLPCDVLRYIRNDLVTWWIIPYQEEINDLDLVIGLLTNGMNGGDNPQVWDPYPEGMTSAQFLKVLEALQGYEHYITGGYQPVIPPDQFNSFLLMLTLRHALGAGWEDAFQALGYGYSDYYLITNEYLNNILKLLVGISNQDMVDVSKWCEWLKELDAEINARCGGNPGPNPCPACGNN